MVNLRDDLRNIYDVEVSDEFLKNLTEDDLEILD